MKRFIKIFMVILASFMLASCNLFDPEPKEFSGSGMTVTLTEDFAENSNIAAQFYLLSNDHFFMGNGEGKSLLSDYGVASLEDYIKLVLQTSKKTVDYKKYVNEDKTIFYYAYYTSEVEDVSYSYMLVTMEGSTKYYTMNFGCYTSTFDDDIKEMYMDWAKTIEVI